MGKSTRYWEKIIALTQQGDRHLVKPTIEVLKTAEYGLSLTVKKILDKIGPDVVIEELKKIAISNDPIGWYAVKRLQLLDAYQAIKEIFISSEKLETCSAAFDFIIQSHYFKEDQDFKIEAYKKILKMETKVDRGAKRLESFIYLAERSSIKNILGYIEVSLKDYRSKELRNVAIEIIKKKKQLEYAKERGWDITGEKLVIKKLEGNLNNLEINVPDSTILIMFILAAIPNLEGIERFPNLEELNINGANLTNLSDISNLKKLRKLYLYDSKIKDISSIENLPNLTKLIISNTEVEEIKGLNNLPKLYSLNLPKNKIKKIAGLDHLISLTSLDLSNNQITDVKGLEKLRYLNYLSLENNPLNPPVGILKDEDALRFIANLSGTKIESIEKTSGVTPFHNVILRFNVEDQCLYCKKKVSENFQTICKQKLEEMIRAKNKKIPLEITKKVMVKPSEETRTISFISHKMETVRSPAQFKKQKEKVYTKISGNFNTLAGTVCNSCSKKFLNDAEKILKGVKTKGSAEEIKISVYKAREKLKNLHKSWIINVQRQHS